MDYSSELGLEASLKLGVTLTGQETRICAGPDLELFSLLVEIPLSGRQNYSPLLLSQLLKRNSTPFRNALEM